LPLYPAFLDLNDRLVLVVGGGRVAARKLASLLEAGALVRLVAPDLAPETLALAGSQRVEHLARAFETRDLEGVWLVISATDQPEVNREVAALARDKGVFANLVEQPELGSFLVPASLRRGNLTLAVSTGGASPAVARRLRQRLEREYGPEWGPYLRLLSAIRARMVNRDDCDQGNRPVFYALVESGLFEQVAAANPAGVEAVLAEVLGPGFTLADLGLTARDLACTP
jgi:precorrin-2 dehydrogenase / sirohydrochlorin ferrochelatase